MSDTGELNLLIAVRLRSSIATSAEFFGAFSLVDVVSGRLVSRGLASGLASARWYPTGGLVAHGLVRISWPPMHRQMIWISPSCGDTPLLIRAREHSGDAIIAQ